MLDLRCRNVYKESLYRIVSLFGKRGDKKMTGTKAKAEDFKKKKELFCLSLTTETAGFALGERDLQ